MSRWFWKLIWSASEFFGVGLGSLAPHAFEKAHGLTRVAPRRAEEVDNVQRKKHYRQVCIWPGVTIIDPTLVNTTPEEFVTLFQDHMEKAFGVRAQFLEEIALVDQQDNQMPMVLFAIHNDDIPKFVIPRLHFGIRWIEDATDPGNGPPLPQRFMAYRQDRQ